MYIQKFEIPELLIIRDIVFLLEYLVCYDDLFN